MIGYYVHHQGRGHQHRMQAIAAALDEPVTVLSSLSAPDPAVEWIRLPADDSGSVFTEPTANGTLHWVPRHHSGLRTRMALIAAWIGTADPALVVVDVSVEVATLCRLMGVPTVVVAMRGDRSDRPHRSAYDGAHALLAPWSAEFAEPTWPQSWRDKTFHAGAISRFAGWTVPTVPESVTALDPATVPTGFERATMCGSMTAPSGTRRPRVLGLWGSGGDIDPVPAFEAARVASPGWDWRFAVGGTGRRVAAGEVWELLAWADVVITHAGQNAVAEVAAAGTPAIVIADDRPHGEQAATAAVLHRAGLAIGLPSWPPAHRWPGLLTDALHRGGTGWTRWAPADAARRTAEFLQSTAAELRADRAATRQGATTA